MHPHGHAVYCGKILPWKHGKGFASHDNLRKKEVYDTNKIGSIFLDISDL